MIKPAEIDPTVLAQSVLGLLSGMGGRAARGAYRRRRRRTRSEVGALKAASLPASCRNLLAC